MAFGCHSDRPRAWDDHPAFRGLPDGPALVRCPNYYLVHRPDPWRDGIARLLHDVDAGLVTDWPGAYSAATTDAVRYVRREVLACQAERMEG